MKKKVLIVFLIIILILVGGILVFNYLNEEKTSKTDAIKFKEEYEALNDQTNEFNGKEYRNISISLNNPFIYKGASDVVEMIENKETFAVYFGFDSCPWCRSVIPTLIKVANDVGVEKIYYVNVKDIRDVIEINAEGELETTKKGTDAYYKLINLLDNVLTDYTLVDSDGKEVSAKEKRIYAPNVVIVKNGEAEKLESGISEKQTDAYMELTEEIKKDTYNKYKAVLTYLNESQNTCDSGC